MITARTRDHFVRFVSLILMVAAPPAARAQSYSAQGRIGYLGEWEIKASLAKIVGGAGYAGPVTLRHVGLCSTNGVEEKSGTVEFRFSPGAQTIEGTLSMADDNCRIIASAAPSHAGSMNCRDGQGVPIRFSIEQLPSGAQAGSAEVK
jgi:hypothetical protein